MDVILSASDAKKRNLGEERGIATGIGHLPDSVLKHILSFLSTKDAVATSALSNRWIELWMSLTNLSFDDGVLINGATADKRPHFMNFVERVLLLREPLPITKFSLCCRVLRDTARINSWISLAVKHEVEILDLYLYQVEGLYVLPRSLFSCESLQELRIVMGRYLQLPKFGCLPKLKKLKLSSVGFPDDDTVHQLLSVFCPVLEELELYFCNFDCVESVCISSPLLKTLRIAEKDPFSDEESVDSNDEKSDDPEKLSADSCQFFIFGTNLTEFSYSGNLFHEYCLHDLSSLAEASISMPFAYGRPCYRAFKLLMGLSNARSLIFHDEIVKVDRAVGLFSNLPVFHNLSHLTCQYQHLFVGREVFLAMLQKCPCLSSLTFTMGLPLRYSGPEDWELEPVPACFITHLESIKIIDFVGFDGHVYGSRHELFGAKILLGFEEASYLFLLRPDL